MHVKSFKKDDILVAFECCFDERKHHSRRIRIRKKVELENSTLINLCLLLMHENHLASFESRNARHIRIYNFDERTNMLL